jgi:ankyrin repeat protein
METNKLLFDTIKQQKFINVINILNDNPDIDINIRDNSNTYLIQYAIMYNNIDIIKKLLEFNCKLDFIDNDGYTILYIPIKHGYHDLVKILITSDVLSVQLVDIVDKNNSLPIHYALYYDNNTAFDMILKNTKHLNILDNKGLAPLHLAIKKKNYYALNKLINHPNINVNIVNNIGETALHIACNYEDITSVKILLTKKNNNHNSIQLDIFDNQFQITPLMYVVTLNNKEITNLLVDNNANVNIQDAVGNTALHLAINENNIEIANLLIGKITNFNLVDINGMSPFHLLVYLNQDITKLLQFNVDLLINNTSLNIQDVNGNTLWHIFAKTGLWYSFKKLLKYKKNNLFIKNTDNETPFDLLKNSKYFNDIIEIVVDSYYNMLITKSHLYISDWENKCANKQFTENKCKSEIKNVFLNNNVSVPMKKSSYCEVDITIGKKTMFTTFTGVPLDIISGLVILHKNDKYVMTTLNNKNIINNGNLDKYYKNLGIIKNTVDFLNFEIIWLYQDIFYPIGLNDVINQFKNSNKNFLIIPLGIELDNGAHANIIIIDKQLMTIERYEPNGADAPPNFNYNNILLDNILENYFREYFNKFKYLKPKDFLPKIGFQSLENAELYKTRKLGDPGGFCAVWCIWYALNRIKYSEIKQYKLVNILINKIKYNNFSFKDIVRNFSKEITDFRDGILTKINLDINNYLNNQYNIDDINKIVDIVKNIIM